MWVRELELHTGQTRTLVRPMDIISCHLCPGAKCYRCPAAGHFRPGRHGLAVTGEAKASPVTGEAKASHYVHMTNALEKISSCLRGCLIRAAAAGVLRGG